MREVPEPTRRPDQVAALKASLAKQEQATNLERARFCLMILLPWLITLTAPLWFDGFARAIGITEPNPSVLSGFVGVVLVIIQFLIVLRREALVREFALLMDHYDSCLWPPHGSTLSEFERARLEVLMDDNERKTFQAKERSWYPESVHQVIYPFGYITAVCGLLEYDLALNSEYRRKIIAVAVVGGLGSLVLLLFATISPAISKMFVLFLLPLVPLAAWLLTSMNDLRKQAEQVDAIRTLARDLFARLEQGLAQKDWQREIAPLADKLSSFRKTYLFPPLFVYTAKRDELESTLKAYCDGLIARLAPAIAYAKKHYRDT